MELERQDLIDGLREIVRRAHAEGVAEAALRLAYFEREATADIDAKISPLAPIAPIIQAIARDRGWPADWLNDQAAMFIPTLGKSVYWELLLDDANVSIAVAPVDALLAMKLHAARPGRDIDDIAVLLTLNRIEDTASAEELYESFYPGDALPDRTIQTVDRMFRDGLPPSRHRRCRHSEGASSFRPKGSAGQTQPGSVPASDLGPR
jgi:hypothetical protein